MFVVNVVVVDVVCREEGSEIDALYPVQPVTSPHETDELEEVISQLSLPSDHVSTVQSNTVTASDDGGGDQRPLRRTQPQLKLDMLREEQQEQLLLEQRQQKEATVAVCGATKKSEGETLRSEDERMISEEMEQMERANRERQTRHYDPLDTPRMSQMLATMLITKEHN